MADNFMIMRFIIFIFLFVLMFLLALVLLEAVSQLSATQKRTRNFMTVDDASQSCFQQDFYYDYYYCF